MVNVYPYLEMIKEKLIELNLFKSVKIGLERGADKSINCPFARIIQESEEYRGVITDAVIQIVIAFDTKNDYETLYKEFNDAIFEIKNALFKLPIEIKLLEAVYDEDRLVNLKAGILRIQLNNLMEYR
jgi:predicted sulfurtransferase